MTTVPTGAAISRDLVAKIVGRKLTAAQRSNANSVVVALQRYGAMVGLDQPHRLAQFLPQALHESGAFVYDRELWGPTAQQKKYDTGALAKTLGNTPAADGDGKLRSGKGPFQLTGGDNEKAFTAWAKTIDPAVPDFYANPALINTDPWEGLSALWYWDSRGLNRYADQGDVETISLKVNGGKNGLADRMAWYGRVALVMLGYGRDDVRAFQTAAGLTVDGDVGPRTRAAMHKALVALTAAPARAVAVQAAPVVEAKPVAVVPPSLQKPWWQTKEVVAPVIAGGGLTGAASVVQSFGGIPWQNLIIIVVAVFGGLIVYQLWSRHADKQAAKEKAAQIGAAT